MLGFLFRRLTAEPARGAALFAAVTAEARRPHWYVEGTVPDTLDGRFAILATIAALALVRLEQLGEAAEAASVALTERFVEVMESEHRELGIGDPTLGKKVRMLVGSLSRRVELWRRAIAGNGDWVEAAQQSVYKAAASPESLVHTGEALDELWAKLGRTGLRAMAEGRFD